MSHIQPLYVRGLNVVFPGPHFATFEVNGENYDKLQSNEGGNGEKDLWFW